MLSLPLSHISEKNQASSLFSTQFKTLKIERITWRDILNKIPRFVFLLLAPGLPFLNDAGMVKASPMWDRDSLLIEWMMFWVFCSLHHLLQHSSFICFISLYIWAPESWTPVRDPNLEYEMRALDLQCESGTSNLELCRLGARPCFWNKFKSLQWSSFWIFVKPTVTYLWGQLHLKVFFPNWITNRQTHPWYLCQALDSCVTVTIKTTLWILLFIPVSKRQSNLFQI